MDRRKWMVLVVLILLSACATGVTGLAPDEAPGDPAAVVEVAATVEVEATPAPVESETKIAAEPPPAGAQREFRTDFSRHTVPYSEILSGGPPKDGIPAIDAPQFTTVEAADAWIEDVEPVVFMQIDGDARAYPVQILMWHEIANDVIGDTPVAVTYCPLCNTAIAFERRIDDMVLDFGTTGRLRFSNLIMYDRQTETWWQQATGEGIAGQFAGRQLEFLPAPMISWADFKAAHPDGKVLSRFTGSERQYGRNPYAGYDNPNNVPFLYDGPPTPGQLLPMARVLTIDLNDDTVAYPYATLEEVAVANDVVGGVPIVVLWQPGVASALDRFSLAEGRDVGAAAAFSREINGEIVVFRTVEGQIVDDATGTVWNVLGRGADGPLSGHQLAPVVGIDHFWFSWAAFKPETRVYQPEEQADLPGEASGDRSGQDTGATPVERTAVNDLELDFEIVVYHGVDALGGERVLLSDVLAQGRPVMVEFWAGLCPLCRRALPDVQEAHRRYGDRVTIVGIDIGAYMGLGNERDAQALYADLNLSFPAGFLPDPEVLRVYRVIGLPTTLYFKPNGELFARGSGVVSVETLSEKLEALIAASQTD